METARLDDSPGQCELDALPALLEPWNIWVAGLETGSRGAPGEQGLDAVVLADVTPLRAARELIMRARDALGLWNEVPVIVLTHSSAAERRTELLQAGADDCMSMPIVATELRARVARLVRVGRRTRDLLELNRGLRARRSIEPACDAPQVLRREGDYWTIGHEGVTVRVRDCKGLHHLARLLAHPHTEMHALMLTMPPFDGHDGPGTAGAAEAVDCWRRGLGNAGAMLDAPAKAAYRRRLESLRDLLDEARHFGDRARVEHLEAEMHALTRELAAAVGLGGRDRRSADAAERARINVTRTIKAAIAAIGEHHRPLGRHLHAAIRTGLFSSYDPPPGTDTGWQIG